jgi:hypothetical protein
MAAIKMDTLVASEETASNKVDEDVEARPQNNKRSSFNDYVVKTTPQPTIKPLKQIPTHTLSSESSLMGRALTMSFFQSASSPPLDLVLPLPWSISSSEISSPS